MDVRDQEAIEKLSNSIDGKIDVLINNAGVADGRWQSKQLFQFQTQFPYVVSHQGCPD